MMRTTVWLCACCVAIALVPPRAQPRGTPPKVATLESPSVARTLKTLKPRPSFAAVEAQLARLTRDPQLLLEAVVGLPGPETSYDRDELVDFWARRPEKIVARVFDFLNAYRRTRQAWFTDDGDRGAILRAELAKVGPIAVKLGQTLSQRPDILPEDVCEALKGLQTQNLPFPDEEAFQVIAEDYGALGPLAPGHSYANGDPNAKPLFAEIGETSVAAASLGQVYKAKTNDGRDIAVKVQRPDAMRRCLLDGAVLILALKALQGRYWNGDLLAIFDETAGGVIEELDFRREAQNARTFGESIAWLGYARVPETLPELTTRRALSMEWIDGRHLQDLAPEEAARMTYMAVEAVTAGLCLTGLVHADPHEGNVMLADNGDLVFLDFGLMSRVDENICEAFAAGIQCVLAKDYVGLVKAFQATGFVGSPINWRAQDGDDWLDAHPSGRPLPEVMAEEVERRMNAAPESGSRFGALAAVLGDMGFTWYMFTPPYIILITRTFLTLEGIANQVDPGFNIYEVAMPWAVRRALAPSTDAGAATLRGSLLAADGTFQWGRVDDLVAEATADEAPAAPEASSESATLDAPASGRGRLMAAEAAQAAPQFVGADAAAQAVHAAKPADALSAVLGSPSGSTLRRVARDLDSTDFLQGLARRRNRPARRLAAARLSAAIDAWWTRKPPAAADATAALAWPRSADATRRDARQREKAERVARLLLRHHAGRQLSAGFRGARATASLAWVAVRISVDAAARSLWNGVRSLGRRRSEPSSQR
jgi:predicted unusual protein kinase regulating ubiquinone biosynthesis (AarF/ABC1/UbiB family)